WAALAAHTSIAIQQQVEILRLIYRGADVLILDEPTAVLAPSQADDLITLLIELRNAGRTIVFISHKLDEVIRIADEITVMRAGHTVASLRANEVDAAGLAGFIIGDSEVATGRAARSVPGAPVFSLDAVSARDDRGFERLANASITVHAHEIVGIAAVAGNGQEELAEAAIGVRRVSGGSIRLARLEGSKDTSDMDVTRLSVRERRRLGITYVSADRKNEGLALTLPLSDNIIAGEQLRELSRGGWLRRRAVAERVRATLERATVRFGSAEDPASSLSGGNQQRVVLGRESFGSPRVIIASQPTRGVDVRGIGYIHELLREAKDTGAAVLLFSEEIDELRALSDRIVVLHRGVVVGSVPAGASRAEIGQLMLGTEHHAAAAEEGSE
ncbi:MAG: ATP-binding cassette domain-containing protein, partial [Leifsonia sp.]